jgi:hypothetical protein
MNGNTAYMTIKEIHKIVADKIERKRSSRVIYIYTVKENSLWRCEGKIALGLTG